VLIIAALLTVVDSCFYAVMLPQVQNGSATVLKIQLQFFNALYKIKMCDHFMAIVCINLC